MNEKEQELWIKVYVAVLSIPETTTQMAHGCSDEAVRNFRASKEALYNQPSYCNVPGN
jgi:hypothetical protein